MNFNYLSKFIKINKIDILLFLFLFLIMNFQFKQPPSRISKTHFYAQCPKSLAPKNAVKIKKNEVGHYKYLLESTITKLNLGDHKGCSYWEWSEDLKENCLYSTMNLGDFSTCNDYLQIEYDLDSGKPVKISKYRSSMFRDNLDITEKLKEIEIPNDLPIKEIELKLDLKNEFELDKKYPYPVTEYKWNNHYVPEKSIYSIIV